MHDKIIGAKLPSVQALSYLGDARHSLEVRKILVARGISKSGELNRLSLQYVTAEAQAEMYRKIEPYLTEDEIAVFKRASNSSHLNKPKRASVMDYRYATGFEAVIGMLCYLGDEERITELLKIAHMEDNTNDNDI